MFRAPNVDAAKAKRKSGWESHQQQEKTESWLRARGHEPAKYADECWELVIEELCEPLTHTPRD